MKRILAIALICFGVVVAVSAQSPTVSSELTEMKVFSIESSLVAAYSIPAEKAIGGSSFLLNFAVADNFAVGVQALMFDPSDTISAMKFSYYLNELLGFSATFGGDGTYAYFGAGAFVTLLKNSSEDRFATAIRIRLEYLFMETGLDDALICLTTGFSLGL